MYVEHSELAKFLKYWTLLIKPLFVTGSGNGGEDLLHFNPCFPDICLLSLQTRSFHNISLFLMSSPFR